MVKKFFLHKERQDRPFVKVDFATFMCLMTIIILGLLMAFPSQSKVLDIIVGGSIGQGLQCQKDTDCPSGAFCHDEQYYCVACRVPPYEWTGTQCKCPEGTVEKDSNTCVECLANTDCKTNYQCDTDTNHCEYCKFPKLWVNNHCVCPAGTRDEGGICVCIQPNTELDDKTGRCVCILDENKCGETNFNEQECICCPVDKPLYIAEQCRTCASVYPDRPIWNNTIKQCVQCNVNADCPALTPLCDLNSHSCQACPTDRPIWNSAAGKCVQCTENAHCEGETPVCNYFEGLCRSCVQIDASKPYWYNDTCNKCTNYERQEGNKCIIDLPNPSLYVPGGRSQVWRCIVKNDIGPYPHAYDMYATGFLDDCFELLANTNLYKGGVPVGSGACAHGDEAWWGTEGSWITGCWSYTADMNGRHVGHLPANVRGVLGTFSNTGSLVWEPNRTNGQFRIWLERQ